jgi:hypothetical protein
MEEPFDEPTLGLTRERSNDDILVPAVLAQGHYPQESYLRVADVPIFRQ